MSSLSDRYKPLVLLGQIDTIQNDQIHNISFTFWRKNRTKLRFQHGRNLSPANLDIAWRDSTAIGWLNPKSDHFMPTR